MRKDGRRAETFQAGRPLHRRYVQLHRLKHPGSKFLKSPVNRITYGVCHRLSEVPDFRSHRQDGNNPTRNDQQTG